MKFLIVSNKWWTASSEWNDDGTYCVECAPVFRKYVHRKTLESVLRWAKMRNYDVWLDGEKQ